MALVVVNAARQWMKVTGVAHDTLLDPNADKDGYTSNKFVIHHYFPTIQEARRIL
jgi:hypothetical protein